jgi:hypothetical protein
MSGTQTVSTNLRISKQNWLQIKSIASSLDMSANHYINEIINFYSTQQILDMLPKNKKQAPIWRLSQIKTGQGKGLSQQDASIY